MATSIATPIDQFSVSLIGAIAAVLSDEDNEFHIDPEMLEKHATEFCHALMNVMPTHIVNGITDANNNMLDSNYLANRLCFQYCNKPEDGED